MEFGDTRVPAPVTVVGSSRAPRHRSWSIRVWLVLVLIAAVLAATAAAGYGFAWTAAQAKENAVERMSFRAERAAMAISRSVTSAKSTVTALAAQPGLQRVLDAPGGGGCLLQVDGMDAFPSARLDVVSTAGRVGCSSAAGRAVDGGDVHAGSAWLDAVSRAAGTVVVWDSVDAVTREPAVVVVAPLRVGGVLVGAVALFLGVAGTAEALSADLLTADDATVTVVNLAADGMVGTSERQVPFPYSGRFADWPTSGEWTGLDGSARVFGSSDVAASPWRVYVGAERSTVLAQARGALLRQLLIGVLALLVLVVAVWVLNRRVATPLRIVTDAVMRARAGRGSDRVAETGSAELVTLAREFNAMLDVRSGYEAQLAHQATHDPFTGLPNRVLLRDRLARALRSDSEQGAGAVAVLHCGLLRFKVVSDSLGHDAEDRLLVAAADRLRSLVRQGDTLARFGDDEFVLICRSMTRQGAVQVAERLHASLTEPFCGAGESDLTLGVAIGIAVAELNTTEARQLLREADTAMREAKQTGRAWSVFQASLHQHAAQRLRDEEALRRALTGNQLVVWYQPLLDVATGTLIGAEALVRWEHPERGLVPPGDFIPLAEETGQVVAIGRFVLREACRQAADWAGDGCQVRVSVNVAVAQLNDPNFRGDVDAALAEAHLAPELLCLEITESSIMTEIGSASSVLGELRDIGVQVAIDDFGTGYSSLSYLPRLPVSELKIDRSFVSRLGVDTSERHLVSAIIAMAGALKLTVVAEGVETIDQLDIIADLNCTFAQGYLLGKPMPATAFRPHLLKQRGLRSSAFPATVPPELSPTGTSDERL